MKREDVQIVPGRNRWLVSRTDRDGVQADGVRSTALVVLRRWLQGASPLSMRSVYAEHGETYVIGAARGLVFDISDAPPAVPELVAEAMPRRGARAMPELSPAAVQRVEDCRIVRAINGVSPWWLSVRFSWHGPVVRRPWPRFSVNAVGVEDDNDRSLDWLLIEAASEAAAQLGKVG
jgi:hypothetical protein